MARRIVRWLGLAALLIGYPLLAHYTNESAHSANLGAVVAIAPVLLIALVLAWRSARRFIMLAALVLSCVALWLGWPALERHFGLVYWLQNMALYVILFITFARTLIAGRQPLCTHDQVTRLAACVVAPGLDAPHSLAALCQQIDPVFLPRNSTGKLPRATLQALIQTRSRQQPA